MIYGIVFFFWRLQSHRQLRSRCVKTSVLPVNLTIYLESASHTAHSVTQIQSRFVGGGVLLYSVVRRSLGESPYPFAFFSDGSVFSFRPGVLEQHCACQHVGGEQALPHYIRLVPGDGVRADGAANTTHQRLRRECETFSPQEIQPRLQRRRYYQNQ
jgi:hypothetical protein